MAGTFLNLNFSNRFFHQIKVFNKPLKIQCWMSIAISSAGNNLYSLPPARFAWLLREAAGGVSGGQEEITENVQNCHKVKREANDPKRSESLNSVRVWDMTWGITCLSSLFLLVEIASGRGRKMAFEALEWKEIFLNGTWFCWGIVDRNTLSTCTRLRTGAKMDWDCWGVDQRKIREVTSSAAKWPGDNLDAESEKLSMTRSDFL